MGIGMGMKLVRMERNEKAESHSAHLYLPLEHDGIYHSVNNRPVKRLTFVARLPPTFYIVPHAVGIMG